jgi:hypothetical protein
MKTFLGCCSQRTFPTHLQCSQVIRGQVLQQAGSRATRARVKQRAVPAPKAAAPSRCPAAAGELFVHPAAQRCVELVKADAAVIVGVKLLGNEEGASKAVLG